MKRFLFMTALSAAMSIGDVAFAIDDIGDVAPGVSNNKIVVGAYDDEAGIYTAPADVPGDGLLFEFGGDDPLQPFFTVDPGFHAPDSSFPAGAVPYFPNATLKFNILSNLQYWDGNGPETFALAPNGSLLTLTLGSFNVTVGTNETLPRAGLKIGTSDGSGNLHVHIDSTISNSSGDPAHGFYRFQADLLTDTAGIAPSDPFYINYELAPEPASFLLLVTGGLLAIRRRHCVPHV